MNSEQLPAITLASLSLGESGILQYTANHDLHLALLNLGVKQGAKLTIANIAPLGDPIAVAVNGTKIAIRKADAKDIIVNPIEKS
mgnify:CR=1 FL=1